MDSVNRIFNLVNEAKKGKGKAMIPSHHEKKGDKKNFGTGKKNRYDHDHVSEAKKLSKKQMKIAGMAGDPKKIDSADLAALRAGKKKVNASTEIANILNIIKEAYQDELISEEAFLTIANPIFKSLEEAISNQNLNKKPLRLKKKLALMDVKTRNTYVYDPKFGGLTADSRKTKRV